MIRYTRAQVIQSSMKGTHRDGFLLEEQRLDHPLALELPGHVGAGRVHGHRKERKHLD